LIRSTSPLLEIRGLVKNYQALRPLRMQALTVAAGDVTSVSGLDAVAAETFVHLVTGATLPDAGDVALFGHNTNAITDGDAWLKSLDGIGMVTSRGILIEMFTALQNIAMSFTLEVDPIDPAVVPHAEALAREVGLDPADLHVPAGKLPPQSQMRIHVARALALGPRLLIAEHASATLSRDSVSAFGADLARLARARGLGLLALTADDELAKAIGGLRLDLVPATGELKAPGLFRKLFG
jgi:predicted ABC-type transport system involved in lysophospholipase L1 biosynthesis ATPase subunit